LSAVSERVFSSRERVKPRAAACEEGVNICTAAIKMVEIIKNVVFFKVVFSS
jgi:hypothetical protein